METTCDVRPWDDLNPDILGLIFVKLQLCERLVEIPRVCKKWNNAVKEPCCWIEIVINHVWSELLQPHQIERLIIILIKKSRGSLRKLKVYDLETDKIFTFIAKNVGGNIENLSLPRCNMNDFALKQITERLSMITILDLSFCMKISVSGIETVGKNCRDLEVFHQRMHPSDSSIMHDEKSEAFAIASTMPKLKRLKISFNNINNDGVKKILSSCPNLEFLDLKGCWVVELDEMNVNENFPNIHFVGPRIPGYLNRGNYDHDFEDYKYYIDGMCGFYLENGIWSDDIVGPRIPAYLNMCNYDHDFEDYKYYIDGMCGFYLENGIWSDEEGFLHFEHRNPPV